MTTKAITGQEHRLGPVAEIPPGEGRAYSVAGQQVAVFRLRTGALRATAAACPHAGGPLADGQLDDCVVVCPLHGNVYDVETGAALNGTAAVAIYPVRVEDGVVAVTVPPP